VLGLPVFWNSGGQNSREEKFGRFGGLNAGLR